MQPQILGYIEELEPGYFLARTPDGTFEAQSTDESVLVGCLREEQKTMPMSWASICR